MTAGTLLTGTLLTLCGVILFLGLVIAIGRWLHNQRAARLARRVAPIRPLLMRLAADDEDADFALGRLSVLDERLWRAIEPSAVALLAKVKGGARETLVELFANRGTVERAMRELQGLGAVRRATAIETLGMLEEQQAFPALCDLLDDRVPEVRLTAARALGRLRNPQAAAPLLRSLAGGRNPAGTVAKALARIGPSAAPALSAGLSHDDPLVRATAAQALGLIGPTPAADRLIPMLEDEPYFEVQAMAVESLGRLGTRAALDALRRAAGPHSPPPLRAAAARALGGIGAPAAIPELRELLGDPGYRVAHEAARALVRLGPKGRRELEAVAAVSGDKAAEHAIEALSGLWLMNDREAAKSARLTGGRPARSPAAGGG